MDDFGNLDSIPMPSTSLNANNDNDAENATSTEAWKRAHNALSSIGGVHMTNLQHQNQSALYGNYPRQGFQGYPLGYGNLSGYASTGFQTPQMPFPYGARPTNIHANANFNFPRINVPNSNAFAVNNAQQQKRPTPYTPFNPTKSMHLTELLTINCSLSLTILF